MRVSSFKADQISVPLKSSFIHAGASRDSSRNIIVKAVLADGTSGYGEAIVRRYLTGESCAEAMRKIQSRLTAVPDIKNYRQLFSYLRQLRPFGAGQCGFELALLDAYGKHFKMPVSSLLGGIKNPEVRYSGVISHASVKALLLARLYGMRKVKIKVGFADDLAFLKKARAILGKKADIRVDANGAWERNTASEKIRLMREFDISAVEDPVRSDDRNGLRKVAGESDVPIIVDESLITFEDAKKLSTFRNIIFDLRLAKNGGITPLLKIYQLAYNRNIPCALGCLVGETGILSAAGRQVACSLPDLKYIEGSYDRFLLKNNITPPVSFGYSGRARPMHGPGLGIQINEDKLRSLGR